MSQDPAGQRRVVVVFGPTGTAGTGAVQACLAEPRVTDVRAVTRRPLGLSHAKLHEVECSDFVDLGGIAPQLEGVHSCLFCLGTSVRNVKGEDHYREIHVTYALAAARALLAASPEASFVYLSGAGANRWILAPLLEVIPALGIGTMDLGRAMLRIGLDTGWQGSRTLENKDLKSLGGGGQ